jgi:hypothetical protein
VRRAVRSFSNDVLEYGLQPGVACDAARRQAVGNGCLICRDVVRGHKLHGDLLLASTAVVVEPFGQRRYAGERLCGSVQSSCIFQNFIADFRFPVAFAHHS